MARAMEREAYSLMEKPQPVSGQEPELQPPPYSSLIGSQSREYITVPAAPMQMPYPTAPPCPTRMPMPRNTSVHDSMSQATIGSPNPMPQSDFGSPYVPTTYDPMANIPPINERARDDQTLIVSSQSADAGRGATRGRCYKICSVIATILVAIGVGIKIYHRAEQKQEIKQRAHDGIKEIERELASWSSNRYNQFQREFVGPITYQNNPNWHSQYSNSRLKRMVPADGTEDFVDYDFSDFSDEPGFTRRGKVLTKKVRPTSGKKRFHRARKFVS